VEVFLIAAGSAEMTQFVDEINSTHFNLLWCLKAYILLTFFMLFVLVMRMYFHFLLFAENVRN